MILSETSFKPQIPVGEVWQSSLTIRAEDGRPVRGRLTTDNRRILLAADSFEGTECEILFGIDTKGLAPHESIHGAIRIISSLSEYEVSVQAQTIDVPANDFPEEIQALEDFEQLCKKNMREGFRLFTHPAFSRILNGKNIVYLPLYRGLSRNPVTYQHLEEFLISSGKKDSIQLSLDKQQKAVYHLDVSQKDTLYIYRSNWGYLHIEVQVEGDFIEVDRTEFSTDDFIGNVYGLEYVVRREKLGAGRTFGRICVRTVHQELVYEIEASAKENSEIRLATVRKRRISWLMRDYLKLMLHQLDYRSWEDSSALTVGEMLEEDSTDTLAILYSAYLHYSHDANTKALETLWPIKEGAVVLESDELKAFYLWLAKKLNLLPAEQQDLETVFRGFLEKKRNSYLLLYLLLQEEKKTPSPAERLARLEECFDAGCTSPFLYLNAWELLSGEEALLRKLSPFLTQVLCFGQKQGMLTTGLLKRAAFLSANEKKYSSAVYNLLARGYESCPDDDILEAICQLLIKGEPIRKECFPWYARAVQRDLRITRLYEYYMETYDAPASATIPLPVRMYFATNNTLGEKKKALLFASIILHREEDPTGYLNYANQIRPFALESLKNGRINRNYAVLYQQFFSKPETPEIAALLTHVLFAQRVTVSGPEIRRVVVCHNALKQERAYPCRDGVAYPRIYSDDASLLFEDERHRRFSATVTHTREPLFRPREIAQACMNHGIDDAGLELYLCKEKAFQMDVNSRSVGDYRAAEKNEAFTDAYRRILRRKLLEYDLAHPEEKLPPGTMPPESVEVYAQADRVMTAQLLIREERFEDAFRVVSEYGYEQIPIKLLVRLASNMVGRAKPEDEEELLCLTSHVFENGKYDETVLRYLQDHYEGTLESLCRLLEKLNGFGMNAHALEEKILRQAMATHMFPERESETLKSYIRSHGDPAVILRFLAFLSRHYFLAGRPLDDDVFSFIEEKVKDENLDDACRLALLKHYAQSGVPEDKMGLCRELLGEMNDKGYRFDFYSKLPEKVIQAYQIEDKIFLQEQFSPESRVVLRYRLTEQGADPGDWISEPMRHVYGGIFVKEFLLFYGETLTYNLRVMTNGAIRTTDTYEISLSDMDTNGQTRYKLINRMLEARDHRDREAYERAWKQYQIQEKRVSEFLSLIEDHRPEDGEIEE